MKKLILAALALCSSPVSAQTSEEDCFVRVERPERVENLITDSNGTRKAPRKVGTKNQSILSLKSPKIPVILVQFPDRPFYASGKTDEEVMENFDLFFNGWDDAKVKELIGSKGSVASYFDDMSRGEFLPIFDIMSPVTLDNGYAVYGRNSGNSRDVGVYQFYRETISKVVAKNNVDWSQYDNDGNGVVDAVFFIYAGWGENAAKYNNQVVDADALWAKEGVSGLSVDDAYGNRVSFSVFGLSAEAIYVDMEQIGKDIAGEFPNGYNPDNMKLDGVGVTIHEFSHALGLPDFYDTKNIAFGMDRWDVMDYGEYVNNGFAPAAYTSYERNFMGWEELPVLSEPQVLTLTCFANGGHGYKIVNPANPDEYYVIENRQKVGWDGVLCNSYRHGLMVSHVDYDRTRWLSNTVNTDAKHQRMTIIAANNSYIGSNNATSIDEWLESHNGNLYPGKTLNYNLTDDSTPAATVFTANNGVYFMSQPLRNIKENADGTVTVCFRTNGKLDAPVLGEPTEVTDHGFSVAWTPVEGATKYVAEIQEGEGAVYVTDPSDVCSFASDSLSASTSVKIRVKAMADSPEDFIESDWSEYTYIMTDADYMQDVPDSERLVVVYSMNGTIVKQCKANELHCIDVHPGVYVVKYSNGSAKKMMLK